LLPGPYLNTITFLLVVPDMSKVTIYHNPRCSKSRQTLDLLKGRKVDPEIVLYLQNPHTASDLTSIIKRLGISPRALLRSGESEFKSMHLDNKKLPDSDIIQAMVDAPILIQRPIVVCGDKAKIGRPPEQVLEII